METGDLAFAEVVQRIKLHLPDAEPTRAGSLHFPPWPPVLYRSNGPQCCAAGYLDLHNVAPREDDQAARPRNAGERLAYVRLPTGIRVIGVNAGYASSFIKDVAEKFRAASSVRGTSSAGSPAVALGLPAASGDEIDARTLPPPPFSVIAYVDGYGNLNTTIAYDAMKVRPGTRTGVRALHCVTRSRQMLIEIRRGMGLRLPHRSPMLVISESTTGQALDHSQGHR